MDFTYDEIAGMIDHSLLVPFLTDRDLEAGCRLAVEYGVAAVCALPYYLSRCTDLLAGSGVAPTTTIGFPHGANTTAVKVAETERALADGAREVDLVVNISKVLSDDWGYVRDDVGAVVDAAHAGGAKAKVIFENCYLETEHKKRLCRLCGEVGADWAKTSTGFGTGGATLGDLQLMREHCPPQVQIKAAGGIRSLDALLDVRALGADRVGASRTKDILDECRRRLEVHAAR